MVAWPKPRGFWDYSLFALLTSVGFLFLFWIDASRGIGWADAVLAVAAGCLFAGFVILIRRGERAAWRRQMTIAMYVLRMAAIFVFMYGVMYADAYFLQHEKITAARLRHDLLFAVLLTVLLGWNERQQFRKHPPEPNSQQSQLR